MNPITNKFEPLTEEEKARNHELDIKLAEMQVALTKDMAGVGLSGTLFRPDGTPVPKSWSIFKVGEKVVIKDYTFECKYIGETSILFEPVGPVIVREGT